MRHLDSVSHSSCHFIFTFFFTAQPSISSVVVRGDQMDPATAVSVRSLTSGGLVMSQFSLALSDASFLLILPARLVSF